jgi:serine/threonine protein kinase/Flp pilus assembly protein TadD
MIGETISHYRIIESLGEGGMGTVYLAEDITLGRNVAIKFLNSTTTEYRARFLREARAVSALAHPNIATVFDYGETAENKPYIVMELIKGQPLSDKLHQGSLPLPDAVRIVSAIAEALGEAHHQGVVHRDVKPSNVVITQRGQVKVLDFGLVKQIYEESGADGGPNTPTLAGTRTRSDVIVGTPLYLSPEQATGKQVDGRSDLFALGAVLYECITGQSAFAGGSVIEIGAQVIHVTPQVPSKLNPRVPPELDRITMKAMQKKVEARYQSAQEFIEDLRAVVPSLQIDGYRAEGRTTKSLVAPRTHSASALTTLTATLRRPRLSLGTFMLAMLAVAALIWGVAQWRKPSAYKPNPVALDWYNKGTDALRNGAFLQATKAFEQSVANDGNFPLAHAALAEAWFELDYADRAKDEMLKVQKLAPDHSRLARSDALHLKAINSTVTREFPSAIMAYSELVKLSPNDAQVYVDLGRAYEKNDEIKKAIESYVEATNRGSQYAPAFLRVAILYGDQLDLASATANLDKAQALFEALGNFEGQAEVAFQRGATFDKLGKAAEARPHLMRALELTKTTSNQYVEVKSLLKLGNVAVSQGDVEGGRQLIHQAINIARGNGIDNQVKRGLVDLGNTFLASGQYEEAERHYQQSLELAQQQKDNRNAARALLALGGALLRRSKTDEAVRSIEQALPFYQQSGYRREAIQAVALLARAKVQKGDYPAALHAFDQQLKIARQLGDPSLILPALGDIGFILVVLGRFTEALPHFDENLAIARASGNKKDIALGLTNRANALWQLGHYDEAGRLLAEAAPLAESSTAARNMAVWFYLTKARMALSETKWTEAKSNSERAIELAGPHLRNMTTEATYTGGLAQVFSGATSQGQASCEKAITIAREAANPSTLSDALLALAQARNQSGDNAGALKAASESQEMLARLGKPHYEWIALVLIARASNAVGDNSKARDSASRAEGLLAGLQDKLASENYQTYLNRPDIRFYRQQLNQLLAQKP